MRNLNLGKTFKTNVLGETSLDFNKVANDDQTATVSVNALRGQAMERIATIEARIGCNGQRKQSRSSADGFLGGIIFNMLVGGAISGFASTHCHVGAAHMAAFNHVATAGMEGISTLRDDEARRYRALELSHYPEGRRACALEAASRSRKFNLVSGSDNNRFAFDEEAELTCMYELIDMLDCLERAGVKEMRLDKDKPVYNAVKEIKKTMFENKAIRNFSTPMKMAV